jgi:hypothetical protein
MVGDLVGLDEMWNTMDMCSERPEKNIAEA